MIEHLKGRLIDKSPTHAVVECNGIGYFLHISLHTFSQLPDEEAIKLYTHLLVREDSHTLYGFFERVEREIFRLLLSVSGIGASTARTMLSSMAPDQIKEAIASGNVSAIQAIKGIGAKTAQRVILDLKDKIIKVYALDEVSPQTSNTSKEEALSALEVLGYARRQAERVVDRVIAQESSLSVENIIKQALKNL